MQRMLLFAELSRLYEVGRGAKEGFRGNQYERGKEAKSASLAKGHFGNIHEEAKSASSLPKESVSVKINQRGKDGKFAVDVKSTSTVKETVAEKTNQEVKVNLSRKTHKVRLSVKNPS